MNLYNLLKSELKRPQDSLVKALLVRFSYTEALCAANSGFQIPSRQSLDDNDLAPILKIQMAINNIHLIISQACANQFKAMSKKQIKDLAQKETNDLTRDKVKAHEIKDKLNQLIKKANDKILSEIQNCRQLPSMDIIRDLLNRAFPGLDRSLAIELDEQLGFIVQNLGTVIEGPKFVSDTSTLRAHRLFQANPDPIDDCVMISMADVPPTLPEPSRCCMS